MLKVCIAMLVIVSCVGCSSSKPEQPQDAAAKILDLLQDRDYSTLFPQRYSEWHKVEAEGVEPEEAVKKLSSMFEKEYETVVAIYEQLASAEFTISPSPIPQVSETGEMATATVSVNGNEIPYRLYKMKNGLWGFHL